MSHNPARPDQPDADPDIVGSMWQSLASGEFTDVQFKVGRQFGEGKIFSAHKCVLCLRNAAFRAMFHGDLAESGETPVDIPDVTADAFGNMLSFLYSNDIDGLSVDNVIPTWMCADKYGVAQLVEKCYRFVREHLSIDNCLNVLENGMEGHAEEIIKRCRQFIDRSAEDVLKSEHFLAIGQKTLVMILQSDTLVAAEHNIYVAVDRWALEACKANNLDPSGANRRQVLGEALFLVRFPLLSCTQIADGPDKSGILLPSEVHDLYRYKFATMKPASLPFSTESRRMPTFCIGNTVLEYKAKVFVERTRDTLVWHPGEIVGVAHCGFGYAWEKPFGGSGEGHAASEQIVPASRFLQPGHEMMAFAENGYKRATFCRMDGIRYVVKCDHHEYTVRFIDLMVHEANNIRFRAANGV